MVKKIRKLLKVWPSYHQIPNVQFCFETQSILRLMAEVFVISVRDTCMCADALDGSEKVGSLDDKLRGGCSRAWRLSRRTKVEAEKGIRIEGGPTFIWKIWFLTRKTDAS